jgi:phenylacetate-CoA ligase
MFECAGISSNDRVGILQPFDLWNIGHLALMALEEIGATTCPLGFSASNDSVLSLLSELSCNALYASPSRIMQLADLCRSTGFDLSLNTILCAGEPILKHHRETAARTWGATLFGIYGSEETDGIGAECSSHAGYHVFNEDLILEVLDPATLKPGSETKGALAVTLLDYSGTALVRYVLGDLVAVDRGVCACGRSEPRVEMEGRIRETVWLFDGNKLPLASIDASLQQAFGVSPDYQLIIDHKDGTDILRFDFVAPEIPIDRAALMNVIAKSSQEMEVAFRYLHSLEIQVEVCSDRHALYTTQRGKTPRVVDRRTYVAHQQEGYGNASR